MSSNKDTPPIDSNQNDNHNLENSQHFTEGNIDATPSGEEQDKKVQWSSQGEPAEDNLENKDNSEDEETKLRQIEELKRKLQGGGAGSQVPAGYEFNTLPEAQDSNIPRFEQYLNFEGADGEFTIPEGETEGLPSLAARRKMAAEKSNVSGWFSNVFKKKSSQASNQDIESGQNQNDNRSSISSGGLEEVPEPPPATSGPTSVLGGLMALKEADNSAATTPTGSVKSMPLTDEETKYDEKVPQGPAINVDEEKLAPEVSPTSSQRTPSETTTLANTKEDSRKNFSLGSSLMKHNPANMAVKGVSKGVHSAMSAASTPGKVAKTVFNEANKTNAAKAERKKAKKERKKNEILLNLAALIERQEFILKLARALMMFGSPSHKLEPVIQNTGKFLEAPVQCMFTPGVMTLSFSDPSTRTSDTKFIKQASGLDLARLPQTHSLYSDVLHGKINVTEASSKLDEIMLSPPSYNAIITVIIGMWCSAAITPMAFGGSFIDALAAAILGGFLVTVQMIVARKETYSNIFEILIAALNSFFASGFAYSKKFCFSAVISGAVVLILPGLIVLSGSMELTSRNITAGSVRMFYAIIYALFLGFGISLGTQVWYLFTNQPIETQDCSSVQSGDIPWYMKPMPPKYQILTAPLFVLALAMRNQTKLNMIELPIMIFLGCVGYTVNYFVTHNDRFNGKADFSSALGSFAVGVLGNLIGRMTKMSSFVLLTPAILFQLPSGFGQGGLLSFADADGNTGASPGNSLGQSLISIANGLTVGLFFASALVNSTSSSQRRQAANFSF